ncbi:hypothetical protein PFLUV_G00212600 [Perca fluviatilis]|uniref:Uncharacterized protein n=1 Tax=Perca fluviatilis TaxID=8168 RepID=A0A6A5E2E7_PERFL|nr:hypothetical protein PFLUV_G00212600 [Perca fluviatilis]
MSLYSLVLKLGLGLKIMVFPAEVSRPVTEPEIRDSVTACKQQGELCGDHTALDYEQISEVKEIWELVSCWDESNLNTVCDG